MTDELVTTPEGNVLVARLNRPEARNALSPALLAELGRTVLRAEADPGTRVLVLTGTGERAFCAGMDLRQFAAGDGDGVVTPADGPADGPAVGDAVGRLFRGETGLPVIGAANATAVGGGLELLLGCDLVVASAEAELGLPEVQRGLIPGGSGTAISQRIPLGTALQLLLTGDRISAGRAYELGLVQAVVPPADVLPTALGFAERIASNGPLAVRAVKELGRLAVTSPERWEGRVAELQPLVFGSEDASEGAAAFVEKRPPAWKGS